MCSTGIKKRMHEGKGINMEGQEPSLRKVLSYGTKAKAFV